MSKRVYTPNQKARALKLYTEHGPAHASRQTGIPRATISKWASRGGVTVARNEKTRAATEAAVASRAVLRERARDLMAQRTVDLLERIEEPHLEFVGKDGRREVLEKAPGSATRDYAVSVGILIDKLRLELGEVTDRTERVSKSEFDREVAELVQKVRSQV